MTEKDVFIQYSWWAAVEPKPCFMCRKSSNGFNCISCINCSDFIMVENLLPKEDLLKKNVSYRWENMSGKVCQRRNLDGVCDFHGKVDESCYCPAFLPKNTLPKKTILQMWNQHTQRWIREKGFW